MTKVFKTRATGPQRKNRARALAVEAINKGLSGRDDLARKYGAAAAHQAKLYLFWYKRFYGQEFTAVTTLEK